MSLAAPAAALAQSTGSPPADVATEASQSASLEEVVVSTRRREEASQDVPAVVVALSSDQLASGGVRRLEDVQALVPGLVFSTATRGPHIAMRGAANRQGGLGPPVGLFQDGVALADAQVRTGPIDVSRVEVAKGPQSTLYGRATLAGAINLVTNNPTQEFEAEVEAGAGMSSVHDETIGHVRGFISGPIFGDQLLARLVVAKDYREGFLYDPVHDWRGASSDRTFARLKLLWAPTDDVEIIFTGETFEDHQTLGVTFFDQPPPHNRLPWADTRPATEFTGPIDFGKNIWDTGFSEKPFGTQRASSFSVSVQWLTGIGTLSSMSSYVDSTEWVNNDLDGSVYPVTTGYYDIAEETFSQEIRLSGGDRLSYMTGLYYFGQDRDTSSRHPDFPFLSFGPGSPQYNNGTRFQYSDGNTRDVRSFAAFGELSYDLTDRLNITAGARWTRDDVSGYAAQRVVSVTGIENVTLAPFYREKTFESVTGSVSAAYHLTDDILGYASYSHGDSPGGFNAGGSQAIASIPFDPQKVDAVELGLKSTVLDDRLRLNVAVFNNDYSDLQVARGQILPNGQFVNITSNAAEARAYGADLELQAVLGEHWRASVGYSYLRAKIDKFFLTVGTPSTQDLSGQPILRSPEHTGTVGLTYHQDVGAGTLTLGGSLYFSSKIGAHDYIAPPAVGLPVYTGETSGYNVVGLTGSYAWSDWDVSAYINNVFGEQYITTGYLNTYTQLLLGSAGEPRTFEVSIRRKF
jgi:iron complex outermembrane receptor protein